MNYLETKTAEPPVCAYPECELKGYHFDLIPTTGKPYACHNACPTMQKINNVHKCHF